MPVLLILCAISIAIISHTRRNLQTLNRAVGAAVAALLVMALIRVALDPRDKEWKSLTLPSRIPLKAQNRRPPDIWILVFDSYTNFEGDHGFRYLKGRSGKDQRHESLGMLDAILLPGLRKDDWPEGLPPVNTFRVVFNHLFEAGLPLLTNVCPVQAVPIQ